MNYVSTEKLKCWKQVIRTMKIGGNKIFYFNLAKSMLY